MFPEDLLLKLIGMKKRPFWVEAYLDLDSRGIPELQGSIKEKKTSLIKYYKFTHIEKGWV